MKTALVAAVLALSLPIAAPDRVRAAEPPAVGIALENYAYPYPVGFLPLEHGGHAVRMAYMDVAPTGLANGRTVLLLHGRNFPAGYWAPTIKALAGAGYRVVAPDQIQFGKSSKLDDEPVRFDRMVEDTAVLLDHLKIGKVDVVAHSMGNHVGVRWSLAHPDRTGRLVMYGPVGLEDYRLYTPSTPLEKLVADDEAKGPEAYLNELMTSYGLTLPREAMAPYVELREGLKRSGDWPRYVRSFAASAVAIRDQPYLQDLPKVSVPVLILAGERDGTAPGKGYARPEDKPKFGHVLARAQALAPTMKNARVEAFDAGHLLHLERTERFNAAVLAFLSEGR
ncbi:alpha/beta hydrolase [Caulobacter zeae]|uniref:Alpha/beta hydrolase n=1 Tax=Caulobacter zeae TaxID=2055137 RepID=A0A2N5D2J7_9CAUL|nr:alpha/beta hydrolase [Caulobacter zeae]PLR20231.1 alpha/beta hydrolase [Caulobacter zeae]